MDLSHLRTFLAVAEAGKMTLAAKRLHLSQPSVTVAVQSLERHLGVSLFVRNPAGVTLTPAGEQFREKAVAVLVAADDAVATARQTGRGKGSTLRVGVHGPAWPEVTATLEAFRRARPDVNLVRRELTLVTQEDALLRGQVDVVFNVGTPDDGRVFIRRLRLEPRVLAVPRGHHLAARDLLVLDDVLEERFVALHPVVPRWCEQLFTLSAERGANAHFTSDEASTAGEVISIITEGGGLFSAPSSFARAATAPGLVWRAVEGLRPVTLDVIASRVNRSAIVRELIELAASVVGVFDHLAAPDDVAQ